MTAVPVVLCTVYGRKPSKNQKDHREQLLANHKPVEKMAGRRMVRPALHPNPMHTSQDTSTACDTQWWPQVGMLKMIRNLAFAHRSQHVQQGRFNTEDEVCASSGPDCRELLAGRHNNVVCSTSVRV